MAAQAMHTASEDDTALVIPTGVPGMRLETDNQPRTAAATEDETLHTPLGVIQMVDLHAGTIKLKLSKTAVAAHAPPPQWKCKYKLSNHSPSHHPSRPGRVVSISDAIASRSPHPGLPLSTPPRHVFSTGEATEDDVEAGDLSDLTHSIAGDSVCSDADSGAEEPVVAAAARNQKRAPKILAIGDPARHRHSKRNAEPEVGNFGLFFGNWGTRATTASKAISKRRRDVADRQILKCPGQVGIVAEATQQLEDLLQRPAVPGITGKPGVEGRNTFEYYVVRGSEEKAILVAARKDNTSGLECLK